MAFIGYARVSTWENGQLLDKQKNALKAAGCERMFEDRASSAHADRPGLKACLDSLRRDDVLMVLDLDQLGRRAGELIRLVDDLGSMALASGRSTQPSTRRRRPAAPSCKSKRRLPRWNAP